MPFNSSAGGLLALPAEVLETIFLALPLAERVCTVPAVCRQLRALSQASSALYADLSCPTIALSAPGSEARLESFVRWLVPRGARVRELDLAVVPTPGPVELRAWRLVLRALAAVAPSCERLHLEWVGPLVVGPWVARMQQLRRADLLAMGQHVLIEDQGLRQLPRLQDVWLVGDLIEFQASAGAARGGSGVTAPADEPCLPASLTSLSFSWARLRRLPPDVARLTNLVSLDMSRAFSRASSLLDLGAISHLTTLQELSCSWCRLGDRVPAVLSSLSNLRVLYLHSCFRQEPPEADFQRALGPLRQLGMLSLSACHLTRVPEAVAAKTSLRGLHLEDNSPGLALGPGPYLSRLVELVVDWSVLFASHAALAASAARLTRLFVSGDHALPPPPGQHPPPAHEAQQAQQEAAVQQAVQQAQQDMEDAWEQGMQNAFAQMQALLQPAGQGGAQPEEAWVADEDEPIEVWAGGDAPVDLGDLESEEEVEEGQQGLLEAPEEDEVAAALDWVADVGAAAAAGPPLAQGGGGGAGGGAAGLALAPQQQQGPGGGAGVAPAAAAPALPPLPAAPLPAAAAVPVPAAAPAAPPPWPPAAEEVAASLAALPALQEFIDVFPPGRTPGIDPQVAVLMYDLHARCPGVRTSVLQSSSFGWRLADLLERLAAEGGGKAGGSGEAEGDGE